MNVLKTKHATMCNCTGRACYSKTSSIYIYDIFHIVYIVNYAQTFKNKNSRKDSTICLLLLMYCSLPNVILLLCMCEQGYKGGTFQTLLRFSWFLKESSVSQHLWHSINEVERELIMCDRRKGVDNITTSIYRF